MEFSKGVNSIMDWKTIEMPYFVDDLGGPESKKFEGMFDRWCEGEGLDIGSGGIPLISGRSIATDVDSNSYYGGHVDQVVDAHNLPYADGRFGFVVTCHSLEHFEDPKKVLCEAVRVLKSKGHLIIILPHEEFFPKKWVTHKWDFNFRTLNELLDGLPLDYVLVGMQVGKRDFSMWAVLRKR